MPKTRNNIFGKLQKRKPNGFIGMYKGPKPRAYSSLSKADKAKEDAQNIKDLASKPGRSRAKPSVKTNGKKPNGGKRNASPKATPKIRSKG